MSVVENKDNPGSYNPTFHLRPHSQLEELKIATEDPEDVLESALSDLAGDSTSLITLYSGADISKQELNRITDLVRRNYPSQEIEHQEGGQPHYQFIISIE